MRKVNTDLEIFGGLIAKDGGDPLEFFSTDGSKLRISSDGSLVISPEGVIYSNITQFPHRVTWFEGDSQTFTMPFIVTRIDSIHCNLSPPLHWTQFDLVAPKKIRINDPLDSGDELLFNIQHFINEI